jgi:tRNA(adenine34) deaminase
MQLALQTAKKHHTPFGAVIAMGDQPFVSAANLVSSTNDPTAHAAMVAIRQMADHLKKTDLSGYHLYTTSEPCPMCMGAAIWANLDAVIYGCSIDDAREMVPQINLNAETIASKSFREIRVVGGFLKEECIELMRELRSGKS